MDINALKAFVEVARRQSFSKASESLFLTQPAISKRIKTLENELDVKLFDRLGKNVFLTEAGNKLLPKAVDMLNQANDIQRLASNLDKEVKGRLTLGTSHHIGLHRLAPVLKEYIKTYPDVDLDIKFMDSEAACSAVENGELEMAIVTLPHKKPERLLTEEIWPDPLGIMVNEDHALLQEKNVTLKMLAQHPAVIPGTATYTRDILDRAFAKHHIQLEVAMATNYLEILKMLALIGLGWTLLPLSMIDRDLHQLPVPSLRLSRSLGLVTHKQRTLSNPAASMKETCLQYRTNNVY